MKIAIKSRFFRFFVILNKQEIRFQNTFLKKELRLFENREKNENRHKIALFSIFRDFE